MDVAKNSQAQEQLYFNKYRRIRECPQQGQQSTVLEVEHVETKKRCIIKLIKLNMNEEEMKRQKHEGSILKLMAKFQSLNVMHLEEQEYDTTNHLLKILMPLANEGDLNQKIIQRKRQKQPFSEQEILSIFSQICIGLYQCHTALKLIHRDLKPANIFIFREDGKLIYKIGDFGTSKFLIDELKTLSFIGTPLYIAPELYSKKYYTHSADIWSLGVILYQLCTLRTPYEAKDLIEMQYKILNEPFEPLPDSISQPLSTLCYKMLKKDPAQRITIEEIVKEPIIKELLDRIQQTTDFKTFDGKMNPSAEILEMTQTIQQISVTHDAKISLFLEAVSSHSKWVYEQYIQMGAFQFGPRPIQLQRAVFPELFQQESEDSIILAERTIDGEYWEGKFLLYQKRDKQLQLGWWAGENNLAFDIGRLICEQAKSAYQGNFERGLPNGIGKAYFDFGNEYGYEGQFKDGNCTVGTFYLPDGNTIQDDFSGPLKNMITPGGP